jgi:hypothetical protein
MDNLQKAAEASRQHAMDKEQSDYVAKNVSFNDGESETAPMDTTDADSTGESPLTTGDRSKAPTPEDKTSDSEVTESDLEKDENVRGIDQLNNTGGRV